MNSSYFEQYHKRKEYLICVDSDGCAMDTMNIKHINCFGPCIIEEWNLYNWETLILPRWNAINLYTATRGINRFKGLLMALQEINLEYTEIEDIDSLEHWVNETKELSNQALKEAVKKTGSVCLKKALSWSSMVNERIQTIPEKDKKPFEGAKMGLAAAHEAADIAVVSSANYQAVQEEWELHDILQYTDILLTQEAGTKTFCIQELIKKGYQKEHILMVGDAPSDYESAKKNGVFFYPILVKQETQSWIEFKEKAIPQFLSGTYGNKYQEEKLIEFNQSLAG